MLTVLALAVLSLGRASSDASATITSYGSTLYLSSTVSSQVTGSWTLATTPPASANTLTQNRIPITQNGYQDFWPGSKPANNLQNTPNFVLTEPGTAPTTPDNKGWLVDGFGAVSFAAGPWLFQAKLTENSTTGEAARLAVGMWKVTVNTGTHTISGWTLLVDPNCTAVGSCAAGAAPGDTSTNNFITTSGSATAQLSVNLNSFSLANGEHLYVQYWRHQIGSFTATASPAARLATLTVNDGFAQIQDPGVTALPNVPTLTSPTSAARVNGTPPVSLSATYSNPSGDTGTLSFQVCSNSDVGCTAPLWAGSSVGGLGDGATGTWTPPVTFADGTHDGTYYWRAMATDSSGNTSTWSTPIQFTVDTVPPENPTFGAPSDSGRVNSQLSATFVDSQLGDSGLVEFQVCSDPACTSVIPTASGNSSTVTDGTSVNWTPGGLTGTPPTGYYWRIRGKDLAGNESASWSATRSFTYDTDPPGTPTVNAPADLSYLNAIPTLSATYLNSDATDSGHLDIQIYSDAGCTVPVTGGSWSSSSGLANNATRTWTPSGLADGTYCWQASGVDAAGNRSAWSPARSFTVDTQPPAAPALGLVTARTNNKTPQLTATFSDPPASDSGTLLFQLCSAASCGAGTVLQSNTQSGIANNGSASWTWSTLTDRLYYFKVTATDSAGNQSSSSGSFTVDTVPPGGPAPVSPANGARFNSVPPLNATFVDSDSTDSGTVTFQITSDAACTTVLASSTSATVLSGAGASASPTPVGPLADGTYYWCARAQDAAGNQQATWSAVRSFVLDTTAPAVPTLGSVAAKVSAAPSLSATFSDPDAPDSGSVSFQVCSDSACTAVVKSGSSPNGIANGASGSWKPTGLADGGYYWRALAQDAAGNQSAWSATQQFTLDTVPPAAPTPGPLTDGVRLNQQPTLTAVYNDSNPGGTGSLMFEICTTSSCDWPVLTYSGTTGSLAAGATGSWTPAYLFDGLFYWRVRSVDAAGNASAWSPVLSFTVDSTPPDAPVLVTPSGFRARTGPALTARVEDPTDPGDQARLFVEICSDAACTNILTDGYSATVPVGTTAGWQAPALDAGTYYWRALAEDVVGNRGDWSATRTFVVDDVAPDVPAQSGLVDAAVVNRIRLSGVFGSSDPADRGWLQFQVCADADCTAVVLRGSSPSVADGGTASWTGDGTLLDDGDYFWRVRSVDAAGNPSAWSATRTFTLDQTPPGRPMGFRARIDGTLLTLSWRPPADTANVDGYALVVNGRKKLVLTRKTLHLHIRLQHHDRRTFAVASVDAAGNMSETTRAIAAFDQRLIIKQARASAAKRHR